MLTKKEEQHLFSKVTSAGLSIALIIVAFFVCVTAGSYLFFPSDAWTTNAPPLQEDLIVQIPKYQNASYCLAWVESANPYVREGYGLLKNGAQNLTETYGVVSLPHSLTFDTHWNNATLQVIYYNYETLNATFDHSMIQQTKYVQVGEQQTYFLDLTQLSK